MFVTIKDDLDQPTTPRYIQGFKEQLNRDIHQLAKKGKRAFAADEDDFDQHEEENAEYNESRRAKEDSENRVKLMGGSESFEVDVQEKSGRAEDEQRVVEEVGDSYQRKFETGDFYSETFWVD